MRWGLVVSIVLLTAAVGWVLFSGHDFLLAVRSVSASALAVIGAALVVNALAASLRLKVISADVGHSLPLREALAVVSAGSVAGAVFFQIAGQLIARGALMARSGIPFAAVVVITAYERAVAAAVSALMAAAGAYYIFGQITLDAKAGGIEFARIMVGLLAAGLAGAVVGFGRKAARAVAEVETRSIALRLLRNVVLTVLVQLPMMVAFVAAAYALSPATPLPDLIAACAIVMFAAAVPISLGGWGVREMSAVVALGVVGVGAGNAFVAALLVGVGSLLVMLVLAILSVRRSAELVEAPAPATPPIDYAAGLAWVVPCAIAILILFQIFVPVGATRINVNLADPLALIAGALFVVGAVSKREWPAWRASRTNLALAGCTLVLAVSLLVGAWAFGWTTWAVTNRFLGWFVLLSFLASGAMIVRAGRQEGLHILLTTFAGATAAVVAVEIVYTVVDHLAALNLRHPADPVTGFAGDRNAFAFQCLMAIAALFAVGPMRGRTVLIALLLAGIVISGSRSALVALPIVLLCGLYRGPVPWRLIGAAVGLMVLFVGGALLLPILTGPIELAFLSTALGPRIGSNSQRWMMITEAWRMFSEQPILGAGLGAFIRQNLGPGGEPLVIHSSFLWLLAETGLLGFLVFVTPAAGLLIAEFRRSEPDPASHVIVLALVAFGVMCLTHDLLYQRAFWLFLGAALALPVARREVER